MTDLQGRRISPVLKLKAVTLGPIVLLAEWVRGDCRYPWSVVGRRNPIPLISHAEGPRVVVFAAHADDETIGLSATLQKARRDGYGIAVVFTTNSRGPSWRVPRARAASIAALRLEEAYAALQLISVPPAAVGCLGFPDRGLYRHMWALARDVARILKGLKPDIVYCHAREGGHVDHDVTNYVVRDVAGRLGYTNVWEWAEYGPDSAMGSRDPQFPDATPRGHPVSLTSEERMCKERMLDCYESQAEVQRVCRMQGERLRLSAVDGRGR